ncbi:MAG: hypothetical protein V1810_01335 [Candidatus Beckwithbacteria bacterium]
MKILGVDNGASYVKAVLFDGQKILNKTIILTSQYSPNWVKQLAGKAPIITAREKNELECLGRGGLWLSGLNSAVVVSCGTGTAVVWARKNQPIMHLGGTGVGGGTLLGLGKLLLKTNKVEKIFKLAGKGDKAKVDLTVGDVVGQGIGLLPPEATAANFGKVKSKKLEDLAASLVGMVIETIGVVSCLAAQKTGEKKIVFCGRVATNPIIQHGLTQVCALFQLKPIFPKDGEYATALGAAL